MNLRHNSGAQVLAALKQERLPQYLLPYVVMSCLEKITTPAIAGKDSKERSNIENKEIALILGDKADEIISKADINEADSVFLTRFCLLKLALNLEHESLQANEKLTKYSSYAVKKVVNLELRACAALVVSGQRFINKGANTPDTIHAICSSTRINKLWP